MTNRGQKERGVEHIAGSKVCFVLFIFFCMMAAHLTGPGGARAFDKASLERLKADACEYCDLTGADLTGVNLVSPDLQGATLTGTIWKDGSTCHPGSMGGYGK